MHVYNNHESVVFEDELLEKTALAGKLAREVRRKCFGPCLFWPPTVQASLPATDLFMLQIHLRPGARAGTSTFWLTSVLRSLSGSVNPAKNAVCNWLMTRSCVKSTGACIFTCVQWLLHWPGSAFSSSWLSIYRLQLTLHLRACTSQWVSSSRSTHILRDCGHAHVYALKHAFVYPVTWSLY